MDKNRHLISRYLAGELEPSELNRFEEALITDPELQQEFDLYREVEEAIADTEVLDLRAQLDDLHEELIPSLQKQQAKAPAKRVLRYAVAASVAVVISLGTYGLFFKKVTNNKLVTQFYKPYDVTLVNRSEVTEVGHLLAEASFLYENNQYREAISVFRQVLEMEPTSIESEFYCGISFFELKEYSQADKALTKVVAHNDNLYIEQADWYLGFCYLMMEEKDKARKQFEKLAANEGIYQEKALKIVKKLR
jgi:tetratricopeptide (TPR) repeat protein